MFGLSVRARDHNLTAFSRASAIDEEQRGNKEEGGGEGGRGGGGREGGGGGDLEGIGRRRSTR